MHSIVSNRLLRTLLALTVAVTLALFASAAARSASAAGLSGPLVATAADAANPDWCNDTNDDPADDCPGADDPQQPQQPQQPQPPPTDSDGDGVPDYLETPALPEPLPPLWPPTPNGVVARIAENGLTAIAPNRAPRLVKDLVHAANRLTGKPYVWGGGHARFNDRGYDCSGATSYVLRSVGLMSGSMVSGSFKKWGENGAGRWVNVYANKQHVFVVIAGLRFDTSGAGENGPRWRAEPRGSSGFKLRHPAKH